jgi:hypothetical protein
MIAFNLIVQQDTGDGDLSVGAVGHLLSDLAETYPSAELSYIHFGESGLNISLRWEVP